MAEAKCTSGNKAATIVMDMLDVYYSISGFKSGVVVYTVSYNIGIDVVFSYTQASAAEADDAARAILPMSTPKQINKVVKYFLIIMFVLLAY